MRISIDQDRCYGSGDCVYRVPSVFTVENGFGAVTAGREDMGDDPLVREAAEGCPSQAITIAD